MDNVSYIVREYANTIVTGLMGIFGTVIGSIITVFISYMLRKGKISANIYNWRVEFKRQNTLGEFESVNESDWKIAEIAEYKLEMDFYNSSDNPQNIRAIKILLKQNNRSIVSVPNYRQPIHKLENLLFYEEYSVIYVPPKQFFHLCMEGSIPKEHFFNFSQNIDIFLVAVLPNGKEFKSKISTLHTKPK